MQIVINKRYGGFGLSREAQDLLCKLKSIDPGVWDDDYEYYSLFHVTELYREDPHLVYVVEQLGNSVNSKYSTLKVVEIPDDVDWEIDEYDGKEWIAEKHRTWS